MRRWLRRAAAFWVAALLASGAWAHGPWLDAEGRPLAAAREAGQWLLQADRDGLRPQDYDAARWAAALQAAQPVPAARAAEWEHAYNQAVLRYLHDLRFGRVDAASVY